MVSNVVTSTSPLVASLSNYDMVITPKDRAVDWIEKTLLRVIEEIQIRPCGSPTITLRRIADVQTTVNRDTQCPERRIVDREVQYSFPGKNVDETWRFACVGKILSEIYSALKSGVIVTKRDIYYRDPLLYKRQATVDRYVDDIAHTCKVTRIDLNVTASAKGLVAGVSLPSHGYTSHVPPRGTYELIRDPCLYLAERTIRDVKWILVIEKEATFKSLLQKALHQSSSLGPGLLVTGKGYPDLGTRRFLRSCLDYVYSPSRPALPLFGLFDCDPHGLSILNIYRHGSRNLAHEQACNVPEMKWLGMRLSDHVMTDMEDDGTVLPLTKGDRTKAVGMLARMDESIRDAVHEACFRELQRMLLLNVKAEMQILDEKIGSGLEHWIETKIGHDVSL